VSLTRFWNNHHQICSKLKDLKAIIFKSLRASKPKGLNRIAKIGHGNLLPEGEEL
jgi:hypothetical protein